MIIAIIEDHPLVAAMTKDLFQSVLPNTEFRCYGALNELETDIGIQFELIVSDLNLNEGTAKDTIVFLKEHFPATKKMFLSALSYKSAEALMISAQGDIFICKTENPKVLLQTFLEQVNRRDIIHTKPVNEFQSYIQHPGFKPLTHQQVAVMEKCVEGLTSKESAKELGISPETVRAHQKEAYARLGTTNRGEAISNFMNAKKLANFIHG